MIALALAVPFIAAIVLSALDGRRAWAGRLAAVLLAGHVAVLAVLVAKVFSDGPIETVSGGWPAGVGIVLRADALGAVFALLTSIVLLCALLHETSDGIRLRSFPALVLALDAGLTGLFLTADVFSFYVFFELAMVAAYVITATGEDRRHLGAAFIFAVVNLVGTFVFLLGIAGLYHVTGTLAMDQIADRILEVEPASALLIAVLFFVAFGVKLGLFPFHFWLPPVYVGARPAVAAILSGALANIGAYGLLRFGAGVLPEQLAAGSTVLIVIGTMSIIYGAIQAIARRSTAEVLAYSAIGQAGYVILAIGIGGAVGFAAAVLYAVVNSLNKTLLFLAGGLRGWLVGGAFAIGALSVAGVPPAAGYLGKLGLIESGLEPGGAGAVALVALIVLGGLLSFVYMFQAYQYNFWRGDREDQESLPRVGGARAVTAFVAAGIVVLGLWPEPLVAIGRESAAALGVGG
jgi:multicomponent Na+:H+ antiporter subunit D